VYLSIIVAAASNGVIGRNNALPWHLPGDLQYFKRITMGKPVVMGRKTFESIGRPLPGRTNVVISRDPGFSAAGVKVVASLEAALKLATDIAMIDGVEELVVIGGEQIYREALPMAQRIYLTEVHADVEGDAVLPPVRWEEWSEISRERHAASGTNPYDYSFVVFERREAGKG
jgi:dihydrofolate reductase